jgi:hypothetical protein
MAAGENPDSSSNHPAPQSLARTLLIPGPSLLRRENVMTRLHLLALAGLLPTLAACGTSPVESGNEWWTLSGAVGVQPDEPRLKGRTDLYFYQNFQNSSWDDHFGSFKHKSNATVVSGGFRGNALRNRIVTGTHYGTSFHFRFKNHGIAEPERVYFRYYLKFGSNWAPGTSGKLPGLADLNGGTSCMGGKPSNGYNCWSARMFWYPAGDGTDIGFYVYHPGQGGDYGDKLLFDASGYTPLQKNRWYCIEGYIQLNDPDQSNGIIKGWINGKPALERSGFRFRKTANLKIESLWHDIYYGAKPVAPGTMDVFIDSLVLARNRIGPDPRACDPVWEIGAEDELFKDMPAGAFAHDEAVKMHQNGITYGCQPEPNPMYCPACDVTRSQMAAFLVRALGLPEAQSDYFDDDEGSIFEDSHNRLATAGITYGCGGRNYCGEDPVTRAQMASFLVRALGLPRASHDFFTDDNGSIHQADINALAEARITLGCNPPANDHFCPGENVTRAQMAVFLTRALGL